MHHYPFHVSSTHNNSDFVDQNCQRVLELGRKPILVLCEQNLLNIYCTYIHVKSCLFLAILMFNHFVDQNCQKLLELDKPILLRTEFTKFYLIYLCKKDVFFIAILLHVKETCNE